MAHIELRQVEKKFADTHAVKPMDLTIEDGEFVVLLGPSGCGKTTTLRMISGLESVTDGQIFIDGKDVTWAHPSDRDIAFVFQFFALYPHMTVQQNIAFPLQSSRVGRAEVKQRVEDVAKALSIDGFLHVRPAALSGGDKQRVALARAMVRQPACFLMDEPIGALDADARETMRAEIKRLHLAQNATSVYVTHDQIEAMALGDRIVVMSAAEVQQVGTPSDIYYKPANLFVAQFIGSPGMNLVHGHYADGAVSLPGDNRYPLTPEWDAALQRSLGGEGDVVLGCRPESGVLATDAPMGAEVLSTALHGAYNMLNLSCDEHLVQLRAPRGVKYPMGDTVRFGIDPEMVRFFHPETELAITRRQL